MRKFFQTAFVLAASLVVASTGLALEKTAAPMDADRADGWNAGTSVSVAYYNICTGWVWVWSGWSPNDVIGVSYEGGNNCTLNSNWWFFGTGSPAGYGFTGTVNINAADANRCPTGAPLASQSFLPVSGWNVISWGGGVNVGSNDFTVTVEFGAGAANPAAAWTDHPAAGPTGPQACGTCYPNPRDNRTFYYGTAASPLCPGSALNDGICDAQFIQDAQLTCTVSVEASTWGSVKNMYR